MVDHLVDCVADHLHLPELVSRSNRVVGQIVALIV